jgi:hypothetical protein
MATEAQIEANRRNAQLSTGPRTDEGKAAVSQNAIKHGLRSRKVLLPDEDPNEYAELYAGLIAEWQPETTTEADLVERMAIAKWKAIRCEEIESHNPAMIMLADPQAFTCLVQHQERLDRAYDRALTKLMQLKKFRAQQPKSEPAEKVETETEAPPDQPSQPKPPQPEYVMHATVAPIAGPQPIPAT